MGRLRTKSTKPRREPRSHFWRTCAQGKPTYFCPVFWDQSSENFYRSTLCWILTAIIFQMTSAECWWSLSTRPWWTTWWFPPKSTVAPSTRPRPSRWRPRKPRRQQCLGWTKCHFDHFFLEKRTLFCFREWISLGKSVFFWVSNQWWFWSCNPLPNNHSAAFAVTALRVRRSPRRNPRAKAGRACWILAPNMPAGTGKTRTRMSRFRRHLSRRRLRRRWRKRWSPREKAKVSNLASNIRSSFVYFFWTADPKHSWTWLKTKLEVWGKAKAKARNRKSPICWWIPIWVLGWSWPPPAGGCTWIWWKRSRGNRISRQVVPSRPLMGRTCWAWPMRISKPQNGRTQDILGFWWRWQKIKVWKSPFDRASQPWKLFWKFHTPKEHLHSILKNPYHQSHYSLFFSSIAHLVSSEPWYFCPTSQLNFPTFNSTPPGRGGGHLRPALQERGADRRGPGHLRDLGAATWGLQLALEFPGRLGDVGQQVPSWEVLLGTWGQLLICW